MRQSTFTQERSRLPALQGGIFVGRPFFTRLIQIPLQEKNVATAFPPSCPSGIRGHRAFEHWVPRPRQTGSSKPGTRQPSETAAERRGWSGPCPPCPRQNSWPISDRGRSRNCLSVRHHHRPMLGKFGSGIANIKWNKQRKMDAGNASGPLAMHLPRQ